MIKAIFNCYQPYGLEYAKMLTEQGQWEGIYFFTIKTIHEEFRSAFPKAILHDYYDAIRGIAPEEYKNLKLRSLDEKTLRHFSYHENICLNMMERNDALDSFRYRDRLRLYYDLLRYWLTVLEKLKPDYIVFEEEPHQATDYLLYQVANYLQIKCIIFLRLPLFRMLPVYSYENGTQKLINEYNRLIEAGNYDHCQISEDFNEYLLNIKEKTYDIKNTSFYNQVDQLKKIKAPAQSPLLIKMKAFSQLAIKLIDVVKLPARIKRKIEIRKTISIEQDQKHPLRAFNESSLTIYEYSSIFNTTEKEKIKLKQLYQSLAVAQPDLTKPYVYLSLNFQPERTTSPIAGYFVNQYLILQMLRDVIPDDWHIIIKEHPSQFIWSFNGNARSEKYYNDLLSVKNVSFAPLTYSPYELIDNARFVATPTGSVAFEAALRGKYAAVFGDVWFNGCDGILKISERKDLEKLLQLVNENNRPNFQKIKLFISIMEKYAFKAYVGGTQEYQFAGISIEENAKVHYKGLLNLINNQIS